MYALPQYCYRQKFVLTMEIITSINKGHIYIPKKLLNRVGMKPDDRVIMRAIGHGIAFTKADMFEELEQTFAELDEGLQRLFVKTRK